MSTNEATGRMTACCEAPELDDGSMVYCAACQGVSMLRNGALRLVQSTVSKQTVRSPRFRHTGDLHITFNGKDQP